MSLSSVIKSPKVTKDKKDILVSRPRVKDLTGEQFCSLDSMWQSSDTEYVDSMANLQKEIEKARTTSEQMLDSARQNVEQIEKEAYDKGYNAGKEEALAEGKVMSQEKIASFEKLLEGLAADRQRMHEEYEEEILTMVKTIVDRILFHEVTVNPLAIQVCLKKAMSYIIENSNLKVHLHSNDFKRLREASLEKPELLSGSNQVELSEDPLISEGGCLIETEFGEIDVTLESRKEKLYKAIDQVFLSALAGQ